MNDWGNGPAYIDGVGESGTDRHEWFVAVIENEPGIRSVLLRLLQMNQVRARAFGSAEQFLADDSSGYVTCAIVDVHLPGMSGIDLRSKLALADRLLPIALITGDQAAAERADKLGATVLLKPFSPHDLLDAVDHAQRAAHVFEHRASSRPAASSG